MHFVTAKSRQRPQGGALPVSFTTALFEGLAPDGDLYVPESVPRWTRDDLERLPSMTMGEIGTRMLLPFVGEDLDGAHLASLVHEALNFDIPLVPVKPGVYALELFHGPTLAFKDVGARVMARLMAALHDGGEPLTILAATSGDTGGAVAHAFHDIPHTRVVVLYPKGLVSPTQEAQLTMFNSEATNVRAYAVAGSFDDCQRLTKAAFANRDLSRRVRLTSANSINVGRLLPQMVYYAHAAAQLAARGVDTGAAVFSTPSGNFGNLTAGVMAARVGIGIRGFVAATNVNDVVPAYLTTGRFEPRASIPTVANAMDVGNPSNFDRLMWLYGGDLDAMRRDITGSRHRDEEVLATIRAVHDEHGYLLDPHSAIAYLGLAGQSAPGVFLATAHPAKFAEIVEPVIGRRVEMPAPLVQALATKRRILELDARLEAVQEIVGHESFVDE
ncbi:MAG: threonine synthase [Acidobacteriota bacterium]